MVWWSSLCARGARHQLLPWLLHIGWLTGRSRTAPLTAAAHDTALYRTSCIVGHLEVEDGITVMGERLWHCRRPGCGAGRYLQRYRGKAQPPARGTQHRQGSHRR